MSSLHPWMYRFSFPGFAEVEWVLPEGVTHDEPWYEPLPWNLACQDLLRWSLDPALENDLRRLHEATFGAPLGDEPGVPFHTLVDPLNDAFVGGRLVAWALRASSVLTPAELPKVVPRPKPQPTRTTWIEIQLVDRVGTPVPGERFRIVPSDGPPATGTLDGNGAARVDGLAGGPCDVTFPAIDRNEWARKGMLGTSTPGNAPDDGTIFEPATRHRVAAGDSMARITRRHGFRDWRTIRGHADNAELVRQRPDPNLFVLGDELFIPEKRLRVEESCATERRHVFEVSSVPCSLRIKLRLPEPCAFKLVVDGKELRAGTIADGELLDEPIDPLAKGGSLTLWRSTEEERTEDNGYQLAIDIGALSAIEAVHGGAGRLTNLGFHREALPDKEVDPDTAVSISRFQASVPTTVTGEYDEEVRRRLREAHDVA